MTVGFFKKLTDLGKKIASGASKVFETVKPLANIAGSALSMSDNEKLKKVGKGITTGLEFLSPVAERLLGRI